MEKKLVIVPFDFEMAKKIASKEIEGRIITRDKRCVRVVCWDAKSDQCILALLQGESKEEVGTYPQDGRIFMEGESPADLMLEIPEYMTFKDGDIATLGWKSDDGEFCEWITILKSVEVDEINILTEDYVTVCLKCDEENYFPIDFDCTSDGAKWIRKPTEPEKQKLINELKASKETKAKEYLKRFFGIEEQPKYQYNDGDLYMTSDGSIGIYSDKYECGCFMPFHIFLNPEGVLFRSNGMGGCGVISECKPVTSATDRIRMVQALRKDENLISKACLKKYFGDEEWIKSIGFKQGVLVRATDDDEWVPAEYGYYSEKLSLHFVLGGIGWKHCIPYTIHTKHLMGTTDNWEEQYDRARIR